MGTPRPLRAAECWAIAYRRTWRGTFFSTVATPVLFLSAMGLGLGSLVDERSGPSALGGVEYLAFLAPGLLAASAMQTGANETSFPVMAGIKWRRTYHAMLATPLDVRDVALGQLAWAGVRVLITSVLVVLVSIAFGAAATAGMLLALPAAVLTGMAFAAPIAAYTACLQTDYGLSTLMRFVIVPMFLFSGTFFPVSQLPDGIRPIAYATPLWHGVELCRDLALSRGDVLGHLGHAAYLVSWVAVGTLLTVRQFRRRLVA